MSEKGEKDAKHEITTVQHYLWSCGVIGAFGAQGVVCSNGRMQGIITVEVHKHGGGIIGRHSHFSQVGTA